MSQPELFPDVVRRPQLQDVVHDILLASRAQIDMHGFDIDWDAYADDVIYQCLYDIVMHHTDGFRAAKELEHAGFESDSSTVQFIEDMHGVGFRVLHRAVCDWSNNQHSPAPFPMYTEVYSPAFGRGVIVDIRSKDRTFIVRPATDSKRRCVVNWEDIEPLTATHADAHRPTLKII